MTSRQAFTLETGNWSRESSSQFVLNKHWKNEANEERIRFLILCLSNNIWTKKKKQSKRKNIKWFNSFLPSWLGTDGRPGWEWYHPITFTRFWIALEILSASSEARRSCSGEISQPSFLLSVRQSIIFAMMWLVEFSSSTYIDSNCS